MPTQQSERHWRRLSNNSSYFQTIDNSCKFAQPERVMKNQLGVLSQPETAKYYE